MFRAVLFNNLYHDIIPNTIADRKARNNGKARLLKIEGNGAIENQLINNGLPTSLDGWTGNNGTATYNNNEIVFSNGSGRKALVYNINSYVNKKVLNHYYLIVAKYSSNYNFTLQSVSYDSIPSGEKKTYVSIKQLTASALLTSSDYFYNYTDSQDDWELHISMYEIIDLTLEFGTGNEPTDVNDKRIKRILEKYRPHNAGTYNSTIIESVETKGFNIWDEETRAGYYSSTTGEFIPYAGLLANKDIIKVLPNTIYYIKCPKTIAVYCYDKDMNYLGIQSRLNEVFTTPANCCFINISATFADPFNVYNHDICINRSGERNGEYVPHRWQDFYQKVEYIESTGTQCINTGLLAKNTLGFNFDLSTDSQEDQIFFGRQNYLQLGSNGVSENTGVYWGWNNINTAVSSRPRINYNTIHNFKHNFKNSRKALLDNVENPVLVLDYATLETSTEYTILLFARRESNGNVEYASKIKLYSFQITDNQTFVRDFIPVYRKQDGTIGLYDLVEGKFYTNQGSGSFLKGADVPNDNVIKLPAPLQLDGAINSRNSFEITKNGYVFTRNVWKYTFTGSETWDSYGSGVSKRTDVLSPTANEYGSWLVPDIITDSGLVSANRDTLYLGTALDKICVYGARVYVSDNSNLAGKTLYYALATPQVITIPKKHLGVVDLGSLIWSYSSTYNMMFATLNGIKEPASVNTLANIYIANYQSVTANQGNPQTTLDKVCFVLGGSIRIRDIGLGTDATAFKEAMKGVYLFYETQDEVDDYLLDESLPKEYQRVEYIESNGTQYIDSRLNFSHEHTLKIYGKTFASTSGTRACIVSEYSAGDLSIEAITGLRVYNNDNPDMNNTGFVINQANDYKIIFDRDNLTIQSICNGNVMTATNKSYRYTGTTFYVFLDRERRTNVFTKVNRLYYLRIEKDGKSYCEFIPCYRKADGVIGLYDKVNKRFLTNQGTGTFLKGNDVYENVNEELYQRGGEINGYKPTLPSEYERVEYLQSSGAEYINTGLDGKNGYTFECDVEYISFPNDYSYIAGFGETSTNRIYFTRVQKSSLTEGFTFSSANNSQITCQANTKYHYKSIMKTGEQKLYRNGELILNTTSTAINQYGKIWLFTSNYAGDPNGSCAIKMYGCQFYYEDKLVRDFIPAVRKSDNVAGLYDMVTRQFFTNQGTGTFAVGGYVERPHETCEALPNVEVSLQCK